MPAVPVIRSTDLRGRVPVLVRNLVRAALDLLDDAARLRLEARRRWSRVTSRIRRYSVSLCAAKNSSNELGPAAIAPSGCGSDTILS
jgi:hypothetical protein